ncbi:MAG: PTS system mannose/fructose/sorbose family transporter subunit IID [Anaerolineae bacterium]|nr:PTS system mannose/fructose/sorbose family transporter subunit IID [Anaerolineae bacterium]
MHITWIQALLIALSAYLAMSVWLMGVGYFTAYRPLIGGTIVGLILGDVQQGMAFGAMLNAVHLGFVSTGGTLPSDLVMAGYAGTALALASGLDVDAALAAFGIPLGVLGGFLWFGRMTLGSLLVHWADARAERGDTSGVAAINLWAGQAMLLAFYVVPTFAIVYYGQQGLELVLSVIPDRLFVALSVVGGMLPAVGIGLLLRSMGKARLVPFFIVGFVLATQFELPILVIALLGLSAAWLTVGDVRLPTIRGEAQTPEAGHGVPRRVLLGAWWRWLMYLHSSYNYERLQGLGFAHAMKPVIEYLYTRSEDRAAALKRHLVFFNSEPQFGALVPAAVIAMEEERASGAQVSDEAINGVKSGLMGPLAGVGDSLIQGLITPLLLSMGISLAQQRVLAGPVLYGLLISVIIIGSSYAFWMLGYRWGRAAVSRILAGGWVQRISEAASVVGMSVLGGLTASVVQLSTPASLVVGQGSISLQADVLDPILRGLLPLALTLLAWRFLVRRGSPMRLIGTLFVAGVGLTYVGLAGREAPPLFSADWLAFLLGEQPVSRGSALAHLWPALLAAGLAVGTLLWRGQRST